MIIYNSELNTTQIRIIENYLAAKYNITINNDMFAFEASHPNELAGIGQDDFATSNFHTDSKGTGIMQVNNPSDLDDGEYFMFGHDNATIAGAWSTTDVPNVDVKRIDREWRVDMTGDVGTVDITFYTTQVGSIVPALDANNKYVVMVDDDGTFSSGAKLYEAEIVVAGEYKAVGVTVPSRSFVTIAEVRPKFQFTLANSGGLESVTAPIIEVSLNYIPATIVTFDYTTASGTATEGALCSNDFDDVTGSDDIIAGTTTSSIALIICDDIIPEDDEDFTITLTSPATPTIIVGTNNIHTYTIFSSDKSREINFIGSNSSNDESVTPVNIIVDLSADDPASTFVDYTVTGTAVGGGTDHNLASGTLEFTTGTITEQLVINITEDLLNENTETIIISLSNVLGTDVCIGSNYIYTYSITDNDVQPEVNFFVSSYASVENDPNQNAGLMISELSGKDITINYTVAGSAVGGGVDYLGLATGVLTIPAGEQFANIPFTVVNDFNVEVDKTITINFTGANGATLGSLSSYTYTIYDDDYFGWKGPGGVGDVSTNTLWLRADNGTSTTVDGDFLASWTDQSGNTNSAIQAGNQPLFKTNVINSKPAIRFDGNNDFLFIDSGGDGLDELINSSYTVLMAGARRVDATNPTNYFFGGSSSNNNEELFMGFSNLSPLQFRLSQRGTAITGTPVYTTAAYQYGIFTGLYNSSAGHFLYENGSQIAQSTNTTPLSLYPTPYIGRRINTYYAIDFSEFIIYERALSTAQKTIVESYLGAKYGINVVNNRYAYGSQHPNEVAGIGRSNTNDMHTVAKGSGIIKVANASSLDINDYFLFGHDGSSVTTALSTSEAPADVERINREWRVDQTGDVGTVNIYLYSGIAGTEINAFDATTPHASYDINKPIVIMVDADGNFSEGAIIYEMIDCFDPDGFGQTWQATSVTIPDGYYFTFGRITPKIDFTVTSGSGIESTTPVAVSVKLNYISNYYSYVDYSVTGGDADPVLDFSLVSGTVEIASGQSTGFFNIGIIDDGIIENSETIEVTLSNPVAPAVLGTNQVYTYTISDNDLPKKIEFASISNIGDEGFSPLVITVQITGGTGNPTSADFTVTGTASDGIDYVISTASPIVVLAGATTALITIDITDDILHENTESIIVTLSNPSVDVNLGTNTVYTYSLLDNDVEPVVEFTYTTSSGSESVSNPSIEINLSTISGSEIEVSFTVAGTATNGGVDFTLGDGVIIIPTGASTMNINPIVIDDNNIEYSESIIITLSSANGATIGTYNTHTYSIFDNDNWGYTGPGGVGDNTTNSLWLRADAGTSTSIDGGLVSSWNDQSENLNNYSNAIGVSDDPVFILNGLNNRPILRFDGLADYLEETDGISDIIGGSYGLFTVAARRVVNGNAQFILGGSDATANFNLNFGWINNNATNNFRFSQTQGANQLLLTTSNVVSDFGIFSGLMNVSTGRTIFDDDGNTNTSLTLTTPLADYPNPYIGRYVNSYYDVDIAEIIQYNAEMNTTQRLIVENYLGAKYGITPATDKYAYQDFHGSEVAGIGRTSSIDMHTAAKGTGLLLVQNASDLNDSEFLLFGHNGGSTNWETTDVPSDCERLGRVWRFDHSGGDVGTISINLDASTLNAPAVGYTTRVVMVDQDGTFANGATFYEMVADEPGYYKAINVLVPDGYYVAFANIIPKVQFTLVSSTGYENINYPDIEVSLNYIPQTNVNINFSSADGSAVGGGVDYTLAAGFVTIDYGTTITTINPFLYDDVDAENDEDFTITLNSASGGVQLGVNNIHTFTINDNDQARQIQFSSTGASGDESFSPYTITIEINEIDALVSTFVDYTLTGTASDGSDYTLVNGTVEILANNLTEVITLPIINDLIDESNETVILTLSNPQNAILGTNQVFTYTIVDNDPQPTIGFNLSSCIGSEGTTPVTIQVNLSTISGQDVTVIYSLGAGTASGSGMDYSLADGVLIIPAGSSSANISLIINDDILIETTETVIIDISAPVGAVLGVITQHTFSIIDNDDIGFVGPGGVGKTENLSVWLDASNYAGPATVATWADISGNGNDATSLAGTEPTYNAVSGTFNNKSVITFSNAGADDYLDISYAAPASSIGGSSYSIFTAARKAANADRYIIGGSNTAYGDIRFGWSNTATIYFGDPAANAATVAGAVGATTNVIFNGIFNLSSGKSLYQNSVLMATNASTTPLDDPLISPQIAMYNGTGYNMDIGEIIVYHIALNSAQRIIVDNYLSSKYNIALAANDKYANDVTYPNGVIGIGRVNSTNTHTAAQGRGIVKISNASSLDDNDFLLLGNNNSAVSWDGDGVGVPVGYRKMARVWQFDETGSVGNISISIDKVTLDGLGLGAYVKFGIILSTDNDFTTTGDQSVYELTDNGSYYEALNVAIGGDKYFTIICFTPQVEFIVASSNGDEDISPASITVSLNFIPQTDITVSYTVADGTASGSGVDYTLSNGNVIINAFTTTATIQPVIIYDVINPEPNEDFIITLTGADNGVGLGSINPHTFTINNIANNLVVEFLNDISSADESFTSVNLVISMNSVFGSDITVNYSVTGGTATGASTDYDPIVGVATILAGQTTANIPITIINDLIDEPNETIIINIAGPSAPAILGTVQDHTYTIIDNDDLPVIQFTVNSSTGSEAVANPNIELTSSATSGQDITVIYTVTGGTATGLGTDYTLASGTATILAGSLTTTIPLVIVDDAIVETSETIIITISLPSGCTIGAYSSITFSIIDDDNFGITGPGGVGDLNNNKIWYCADGIVSPGDGNPVSQFDDQSGNAYHATQALIANQPLFVASAVNGKPALSFNGISRFMTYPNGVTFLENTNYTLFAVASRSSSTQYNAILGDNLATNQNGRYIRLGWTSDNRFNTQTRNTGAQVVNGTLINTSLNTFTLFSTTHSSSTGKKLYENGGIMTLGTVVASTSNITNWNGTPYLGRTQNTYSNSNISEVIIYTAQLNTAQLNIVNSYLAAKYGLSISSDKYSYDLTHGNEVAGIGKDDATNFHTTARGTGMIKVSSASSLDNGDYLLWGHDNGDITSYPATLNVPTDVSRLGRIWRFTQTGNVGTVTITAYGINGGIAIPAGTKCVLITDADGDFTANAVINEMNDLGGGTYDVNNISVPNGYYMSIGYITPKVEFSLASSTGNEASSPANIQINLNYLATSDITVNYNVSGITATSGGVDFTLGSPGSVIITAGSSSALIQPIIINDVNAESNETFSINLTSATAPVAIGINSLHTFTIIDDDFARLIQFASTGASADESLTPSITIQINNTSVAPTTVIYTISGTATGGSDYSLISGIATINPGDLTTTLLLGVIDDLIDEVNETVIITLSSPTNSGLGTNSVYTYTIIDNDNSPTIAFSSATSSSSEGGSTTINISVTLSQLSGAATSVFFQVIGGTASGSGTDYTFSNATLTIPANSLSANISFTIVNDNSIELDETVIITISSPTNATLGAITTHTYTIIDDDNIGITGPGGVGDATFNKLWFLADNGTTTPAIPVDGTNITAWTDFSGAGNDASTAASPQFYNNVINSKPVIRFIYANGDYLDYPGNFVINSTYSVFAVASRNDNTNGRRVPIFGSPTNVANQFVNLEWYDRPTDSPDLRFGPNANWATGNSMATTLNTQFNVPILLTGVFSAVYGKKIYENGTYRGGIANTNFITSMPDVPRIGFVNGNSASIDIAELIQYKTTLNNAQRKIVENYLAAKYNLTISNDLFAYDIPYGNEVIGIGRDNSTEYHNAAQGRGLIKISNANSFGDLDYLLMGHDAGDITTWRDDPFTFDLPTASGTKRLDRVYRFDEKNEIGTITMTLEAATLPAIDAGNSYMIVVDTDNDGVFATGRKIYPMTNLGGTVWEAYNVDITNDNRFILVQGRNISQNTGFFDDVNTWLLGTVPITLEEAIIDNGHIVTLRMDHTVGSVTINLGGELVLGTYKLSLDNTTITNNGTFTANTGTVEYEKNDDQTVSNVDYYNLTISGIGVKSLAGSTNIDGNLVISAGSTLDVTGADFTINLAGNWSNSNSFLYQGGTVIFDGTADQTISNSQTFNSIEVDKATGKLLISQNVTITTDILLSQGMLDIGTRNLILLSTASISWGGLTTSYIQADGSGLIEKQFSAAPAAAINFHIGDVDEYSPLTFTLQGGTLATPKIFINVRDAVHPSLDVAYSHISRYWNLTSSGIASPNYDLVYTYASDLSDVVGTEGIIYAAKFSGGAWSRNNTTTDIATNTLTWTGVTSFSEITGASMGALPIELISFNAIRNNEVVNISWITSAEINNDFFTIQKTLDFEDILNIENIKGAGNSNEIRKYYTVDQKPFACTSYYRLKQTDFDGKFTYSDWVAVSSIDFDDSKFNIYPNPVSNNQTIYVDFNSIPLQNEVLVVVRNVLGVEMFSKVYIVEENQHSVFAIDPRNDLPSGIYLIIGTSDNKQYYKKIIIK